MLNYLREKMPNVYIVLTTIAIVVWFRTWSALLDMAIPKQNAWFYYLLSGFVAMIFLYINDFSLSELHQIDSARISGATQNRR